MNWEKIYKLSAAILTSIGSASLIIFALSSWLGKVWANRILEQEKKEHSKDIEQYKSVLNHLTKRHEIIFTKLHENRAHVIEQLYENLINTDTSFHSLVKPFQTIGEADLNEKFGIFVKNYNEYYQFYQKKRIYFSPSVCKIIDDLNKILFESHVDLTMYPIDSESSEYKFQPELIKERNKYWNTIWERYKEEFSCLKDELENSFRSLLGVEE
jgi:cell division protein FtsB